MTLLAAFLLASTPIVPAGTSFDCTPVRVWDGDVMSGPN